MPVTPAHAAATPLLRRLSGGRLVLSAVVVGTMAPDFEYLVHLRTHRTIGHSPAGLLLLCVPSSLLALFVWHRWLQRPLAALVPASGARLVALAQRPFPFRGPGRVLLIVESILIGAASHLVWDSFTHANGVGVRNVSLLRLQYGPYPGWQWAQYLSGVLGAAYLATAIWRWSRQPGPREVGRPGPALSARARRLHAAALVGLPLAGAVANAARTGGRPGNLAAAAAVGVMSAAVVAAAAVALSLSLSLSRRAD